jgi:hypothetical protein
VAIRIREIAIAGYRSLRSIRFPVGQLTVFVGANGVGKTNLYRALQLMQAAAAGTLARELASEGGMESALWAGKRSANKPVRMKLQVGLAADSGDQGGQQNFDYGVELGVAYSYEIDVGLRVPFAAAFPLEPQVKTETLIDRGGRRPISLLDRRGPHVTAIDDEQHKHIIEPPLLPTETALGSLQDPGRFGDIDMIRRTMLDWRFLSRLPHRPAVAAAPAMPRGNDSDTGVRRLRSRRSVCDARPYSRGYHGARSHHRRCLSWCATRRADTRTHCLVWFDRAGLSQAGIRGGRTVRRYIAIFGPRRRAAGLPVAGVHRA